MNSKIKKFLKVLTLIGLAGIGLFIVAVVVLFLALPSASQIGSVFHSNQKKSNALQTADQTPPKQSKDFANGSDTLSAEKSQLSQSSDESNLNLKNEKIMQDMMDTHKPLVDFCRHLSKASDQKFKFKNINELGKRWGDQSDENKDLAIESFSAIIKYVFRLPEMKALIARAQQAHAEGDNQQDLFKKADFYQQAILAFQEIKSQQENMETLLNRTYNLNAFAQVIAQRPGLLSDPSTMEYCLQIEKSVNKSSDLSPLDSKDKDWKSERASFLEFLNYAQIEPKDIGYNPNYETHLKYEMNSDGFHFTGGWVDDLVPPASK